MVNSREVAAKKAEATTHNVLDTCQLVTRGYYDAPSVGDYDHNGRANALDGWKSEPEAGCHYGDRNPPRGVPVFYRGGSKGDGHRAISLGGGKIRSTDCPTSGVTSTTDIGWPERAWGLEYVGWSETIDGYPIPTDKPTPVKPATTTPKLTPAQQVEQAAKDIHRDDKRHALRSFLRSLFPGLRK